MKHQVAAGKLKIVYKKQMSNCTKCSNELTGKYCSNCGHAIEIPRIDGHYVVHEIEHVLHFEKGILLTIKELLIRPGQTVKEFIAKDRSKLVKPIIFIIITSLAYTLINHSFHIETEYISFNGEENSVISSIFDWIQNHYGYANIIIGVFIAFWLKLFFKKYEYNFFEILILLCFIIGIEMLIFSVFSLLEGLTKISLLKISGILGISYCCWAIGQFFDKRKAASYFKGLASYILGLITFSFTALLLGLLIGLFFKH
ncbi:hypothetical protein HDE68_003033 [Pedobacter cryoconitis]|uniref:DUF3667 domain-containing protein n=1 Tax=Pedobacter cryoconitis TaxID=188932 RepID=A0A7W9E0Y9_9SPHI|nr:DUF3667 domain-containing protein [Pedobacter cryoconitis]MBB5637120.1 hypothetical protein [Pedobacter cryoconitis]